MSLWEPNNPEVINLAEILKGETDEETAENIWDWMKENIEYEHFTDNKVHETIKTGKGNCADQSYLVASLLLAAGCPIQNVRIVTGSKMWGKEGHQWTEFKTDVWHRFDTTQMNTFEMEYSSELYQEGKDCVKIEYFYYESPKISKIELKTFNKILIGDTHELSLYLANTGEIERVLTVEIYHLDSNTIHDIILPPEITLPPGGEKEIKIYLKGEGRIRIEIDEIRYETELCYDSEEKSGQSPENDIEKETPGEKAESEEKETEPSIEVRKILNKEDNSIRKIRVVSEPENETKQNMTKYVPFLIIIPVFILLFKKFF